MMNCLLLLPKTYDVVWSLIPLVVTLWCLLALVVPIAGFFIWLIYVARNYPASPAGTATRTGKPTAE